MQIRHIRYDHIIEPIPETLGDDCSELQKIRVGFVQGMGC